MAILIVSNARQSVNSEPAKEDPFYKDNLDILRKMPKACEVVNLPITLETEDAEGAEDIESTENMYTKIDMPFSSLMIKFF